MSRKVIQTESPLTSGGTLEVIDQKGNLHPFFGRRVKLFDGSGREGYFVSTAHNNTAFVIELDSGELVGSKLGYIQFMDEMTTEERRGYVTKPTTGETE